MTAAVKFYSISITRSDFIIVPVSNSHITSEAAPSEQEHSKTWSGIGRSKKKERKEKKEKKEKNEDKNKEKEKGKNEENIRPSISYYIYLSLEPMIDRLTKAFNSI